jgi:lysozyme
MSGGEFDALTSFTFNLGSGTLQRSTLRARVNRQDPEAYQKFAKYVYAAGKRLKGLVLRRQVEARLYCS